MKERYRISELAQKAGVTKRTIHYYINKGLLPPSEGAGVNSYYNGDHLIRILFIKKLQERFLPLDNIREIINSLSSDQINQELNSTSDNISEEISFYNVEGSVENNFNYGVEYIRVNLGKGLELSFPKELQNEEGETIKSIIRFANKMMSEK